MDQSSCNLDLFTKDSWRSPKHNYNSELKLNIPMDKCNAREIKPERSNMDKFYDDFKLLKVDNNFNSKTLSDIKCHDNREINSARSNNNEFPLYEKEKIITINKNDNSKKPSRMDREHQHETKSALSENALKLWEEAFKTHSALAEQKARRKSTPSHEIKKAIQKGGDASEEDISKTNADRKQIINSTNNLIERGKTTKKNERTHRNLSFPCGGTVIIRSPSRQLEEPTREPLNLNNIPIHNSMVIHPNIQSNYQNTGPAEILLYEQPHYTCATLTENDLLIEIIRDGTEEYRALKEVLTELQRTVQNKHIDSENDNIITIQPQINQNVLPSSTEFNALKSSQCQEMASSHFQQVVPSIADNSKLLPPFHTISNLSQSSSIVRRDMQIHSTLDPNTPKALEYPIEPPITSSITMLNLSQPLTVLRNKNPYYTHNTEGPNFKLPNSPKAMTETSCYRSQEIEETSSLSQPSPSYSADDPHSENIGKFPIYNSRRNSVTSSASSTSHFLNSPEFYSVSQNFRTHRSRHDSLTSSSSSSTSYFPDSPEMVLANTKRDPQFERTSPTLKHYPYTSNDQMNRCGENYSFLNLPLTYNQIPSTLNLNPDKQSDNSNARQILPKENNLNIAERLNAKEKSISWQHTEVPSNKMKQTLQRSPSPTPSSSKEVERKNDILSSTSSSKVESKIKFASLLNENVKNLIWAKLCIESEDYFTSADANGNTVLIRELQKIGQSRGSIELVYCCVEHMIILKLGSYLDVKNHEGQSALDLIQILPDGKTKNLLLNYFTEALDKNT